MSKENTEIQQEFISTSLEEHDVLLLASSSKLWDTSQGKAIDFGNLIHEMMAKVVAKKDIEKVVKQYLQMGYVSKNESVQLQQTLLKVVENEELKNFFTDELTVFNEREIVTVDNQIVIPDRLVLNAKNEMVIIDYKTGEPSKSHHQQVLRYAQVLKAMNFSISKKLLVYINEEIDTVEV